MRFFVVSAGIVLAVTGCATQDQLRQTEAQQGQAVQALRAGADRSESVISDLRTEIRRTQESVHELEVALTDARGRTDAAKVQADSALSTSREFLANLIAAREEQRRQLDENGVAFADLRRKAADLESRLQAQQRLIDQGNVAFNDAIRRLIAVEAGLQEAGRGSMLLAAKAKAGQEADDGLTRQLATLRKQVEDTRSVLSSESLLQMMRELEGVRRNSASLRGSIEELQKAQADSAAQARNYFLDLDSRVRQLKQPAPQPAAAAESAVAPAAEPDHPVSQ
jgi:predicted  nucleic acid-binding Zn-ribbon protein